MLSSLLFVALSGQVNGSGAPELAKVSHAFRSIDPADEDFSDLAPLAEAIGRSRLVVLGENSHGDGATTLAKCRLIKFLHQKMGFDVVVWEAGPLDCWQMNAAFRDDQSAMDAALRMMRGGWATSAYCQSLFEYVKSSWKTNRPLEMAGFDTGARAPLGKGHYVRYISGFFSVLPDLALASPELSILEAVAGRLAAFIGSDTKLVSLEDRAAQRALLEGLLKKVSQPSPSLQNVHSEAEIEEMKLVLSDMLAAEESRYFTELMIAKKVENLPADWYQYRDRQMAKNLLWLLNEKYRGRKLIVWAATAHLTRNSHKIQSLEKGMSYEGSYQAGDDVFKAIGSDLYTVAFTSYSGKVGNIMADGQKYVRDLEPAPEDSFEALAHAIGKPFLFVDLRALPPTHFLGREMVARPLGYGRSLARWGNVVDAFFFIDEMYPEKDLPIQN